jgi:chromosome partitioning protein
VFGFNPDLDIEDEETLLPFFRHGATPDLSYAVRKTSWPGIDLIAANLGLYQAEYEAAARLRGNADSWTGCAGRSRSWPRTTTWCSWTRRRRSG